MKKLVAILALSLGSVSAFAWGHYGYRGGYYHGGWGGWVAPAVVGGVIGYELARPVYTPPSVVYTPAPTIVQPVQMTDPNNIIVNGVLYRKTMMEVNGAYQEVLVRP
jgi:hypothetical protein